MVWDGKGAASNPNDLQTIYGTIKKELQQASLGYSIELKKKELQQNWINRTQLVHFDPFRWNCLCPNSWLWVEIPWKLRLDRLIKLQWTT